MEKKKQKFSRRDFLKIGGLTGIALQVVGFAGAGLAAGQDIDSYTGYKNFAGVEQTFNRKAFEMNGLPYEKVGETRRPGKYTEFVFLRGAIFHKVTADGWKLGDNLDVFPPPIQKFYQENPEVLELDWQRETDVIPKAYQDHQKYDDYFALANAYSAGWNDLFSFYPPEPTAPPEVSDFTLTHFKPTGPEDHSLRDPIPFKSADHAAQLIKKIAHQYGATLVGITKLNPDFCYDMDVRGGEPGPFEIPAHWKYAIVFGVPHEWDQVLSNPAHGTSYDGYSRVRNTSGRLTAFIKSLGYPARSHHPPIHYDLICPPIAVDAGIGQLGRHGLVICPETGTNIRLAVVTTNIPMTVDKPIDFGVADFCSSCKICAEQCPSGAISLADSAEGSQVRGYQHWYINGTKCYNFWLEAMGPLGCRLCLAVCPYSRKNNWVHQMSKVADANDPTGLVNDSLIWMQKSFFEAPDVQEYRRPPDGRFAGYRPAPEWLEIENWFAISPLNPQKGA